jgi:hypothetical protein
LEEIDSALSLPRYPIPSPSPVITSSATSTSTGTNTNNDNDVNASNSNNVITNTGNTVTINNNIGRRSLRSLIDSFLDPELSSLPTDFIETFLKRKEDLVDEVRMVRLGS